MNEATRPSADPFAYLAQCVTGEPPTIEARGRRMRPGSPIKAALHLEDECGFGMNLADVALMTCGELVPTKSAARMLRQGTTRALRKAAASFGIHPQGIGHAEGFRAADVWKLAELLGTFESTHQAEDDEQDQPTTPSHDRPNHHQAEAHEADQAPHEHEHEEAEAAA